MAEPWVTSGGPIPQPQPGAGTHWPVQQTGPGRWAHSRCSVPVRAEMKGGLMSVEMPPWALVGRRADSVSRGAAEWP